MTLLISQKFRFFSFIAIALLVFVHGYNLNETYLFPFSSVVEPMTFTAWFEYFFANGILRFRIPVLFIISGYIFAHQDHKPYDIRIKKRFKSLIIPYLFWSAFGLALTFLLQRFSITAQAVANARLDQLGDNRPYEQIGWEGIITRWLLIPISFQLWFIKALFIYNVAYKPLKWIVLHYTFPWLLLTFSLYIIDFNFFALVEGTGLFFFSLGIWIRKTNFSIERPPRWFSQPLAWLFYIGCSVIKTFMAFELEPQSTVSIVALTLLYTSSVIAGIMAVWFGLDKLVRWCMVRPWFTYVMAFSFIIYAMHVPLEFYITQLCFYYLHHFTYYRLLTYVAAPTITIVVCVFTGYLLRYFTPSFYKVITGGRGSIIA